MRVPMRAWTMPLAMLCACSVVFDTDRHRGNERDASIDVQADVPDARLTIEDTELCQALAEPYCEAKERCCPSLPSGFTFAECVRVFNLECNRTLGAWVLMPELGYDGEAVLDLHRELVRIAGECGTVEMGALFNGPVLDIFAGSVPPGGVCSPRETPEGGTNYLPLVSCAGESVCRFNGFGSDYTCGERKADGEVCLAYIECDTGLGCYPEGVVDFQCRPRATLGERCVLSGDCTTEYCAPGDAGFGTCANATVTDVYCGDVPPIPQLDNLRGDATPL